MAAADFFLPPIYSFQVEDPEEVVDLVMFLVVALVSSNLASRLRAETKALRRREKEIHQLYEFSQGLAACFTVSDLICSNSELPLPHARTTSRFLRGDGRGSF